MDGENVSKFLDTEIQIMQLKVKRTLIPSREEVEEEFCQGLTPLDDAEDSRVDNSLDEDRVEESEEDEPPVSMHQLPRARPSFSRNNNVLEVVRQEMKELESRLVRVINGRCDHIETKLDRLLKLVESSVSQPQGENKGQEKDCVFEAAVENSVKVEDCTYKEEQFMPIQGEGRRSFTGQDQFGESSSFLIEDETDEESPKGRGQRKMRKEKALRTPWTNPLKRRKFKNPTVYDPFLEVA
ncbi:hypothetical protein Adt_27540 [Abeliophyllum distichum]|uniref:Uncharacterized protein n=1 Tax=Abeliophyllum distichum TaxID=126358 RepID=A0ABD1RU14_9LAMI